ncbi:hypothetical protein ACWN8V_09620 [Vagococcus elongatus]|uniref:DUF5105 domain-containing protein n=1 Tax=Vagococcus elongatus TaxID=180344 RepID=A0A430AR63_9ENTE|nr:hypothetical protein [Vagococcus elongatus]RSU10535.1 hypothetical protein CBF29_09590 [Vagococcus elongatus]
MSPITKKSVFLIMFPLLAVLMLTSCKEAVKPEEAGVLFVNQLVFQEDKDLFAANFSNGEELSEEINLQKKTLVANIVSDINQFGGVISSEQTEAMVELWIKKMMTTTQFQLKSLKDLGQRQYEVYFTVTGLDFIRSYQEMTDDLVDEMLNNPEISTNNYKLGDSMVASMTEAIEDIRQSEESVKVSLILEKDGSQWKIDPKEREKKATQMLLAFLSGHGSSESLAEEMQKVVQRSMTEAQNMIDDEYKGKKEKTSRDENKPEDSSSEKEETSGEVTIETEETYDTGNDSSNEKP